MEWTDGVGEEMCVLGDWVGGKRRKVFLRGEDGKREVAGSTLEANKTGKGES